MCLVDLFRMLTLQRLVLRDVVFVGNVAVAICRLVLRALLDRAVTDAGGRR